MPKKSKKALELIPDKEKPKKKMSPKQMKKLMGDKTTEKK